MIKEYLKKGLMVASVAAIAGCSPATKSVSSVEDKVEHQFYEAPTLISQRDLNSLLLEMPIYHNLKSEGLSLDVFYDPSLKEQKTLFSISRHPEDSSAFEIRINPPTRIEDLFDHEFDVYRALIRTEQLSTLIDHYYGVGVESERWKHLFYLSRLTWHPGFPGREFDEKASLLIYQHAKYGSLDRQVFEKFRESHVRAKLLDVYTIIPQVQFHVDRTYEFIDFLSNHNRSDVIQRFGSVEK